MLYPKKINISKSCFVVEWAVSSIKCSLWACFFPHLMYTFFPDVLGVVTQRSMFSSAALLYDVACLQATPLHLPAWQKVLNYQHHISVFVQLYYTKVLRNSIIWKQCCHTSAFDCWQKGKLLLRLTWEQIIINTWYSTYILAIQN